MSGDWREESAQAVPAVAQEFAKANDGIAINVASAPLIREFVNLKTPAEVPA